MSVAAKTSKATALLIVDDEPDFRRALEFSFRRLGYQVFSAANGRDAFDLIQSSPIDMVVSDIRMPGGDGVDLLDRTKKVRPDLPIVLLVTGFADLSAEEAHQKGAEALFGKPLDPKVLHEAICRLLTTRAPGAAFLTNYGETELPIQLKFQAMSEIIPAHVLRVGRGGMFVRLPEGHYPNVNDPVGFGLNLDQDSDRLDGTGVVRWVRTQDAPGFPTGCGIEFIDLDESGKKWLGDYLTPKAPSALTPTDENRG